MRHNGYEIEIGESRIKFGDQFTLDGDEYVFLGERSWGKVFYTPVSVWEEKERFEPVEEKRSMDTDEFVEQAELT